MATTKKNGPIALQIENCGSSAKLNCLTSTTLQRCMSSATVVVPKGCGSSAKIDVWDIDRERPLRWEPGRIDPQYQLELQLLLMYALVASESKVPAKRQFDALTKQMTLRTREDIEALERRFKAAIKDLGRLKRQVGRGG